ncbi:DUF2867 domain-containing protein [Segnochrobactraceae bacterium EtOH-i3]
MPAAPDCTLRPPSELDFYDRHTVSVPADLTPLEAWALMTASSGWLMRLAFQVRDAISSRFGVKRIGGFSGRQIENVQAGDRLDFFLVEHVAPNRLILTERDRHLDVMICVSKEDNLLSLTASVITHNIFGRFYMLPVGPAHRLIVHTYLRRLKRKLAERAA